MTTLVDLLIEKREKEKKYFKNYLNWAKKIKKETEKSLWEVKVFLFGSIVKGKAEPGSDIDILVISPKLKNSIKKNKVRTKIQKKIGLFNPFEIHLITPEEYQNWYKFFIKEKVEIT